MKKVYIVTEQQFYVSQGYDYAMAFDSDGDLQIFKNRCDAVNYIENRCEKLCRMFGVDYNSSEIKDEIIVSFGTIAGGRIIIKLSEKKIR